MKGFEWRSATVTHMHIELSNLCNAACPFCPRSYSTTPITRPDLLLEQITLDQFKEWFPPDFMQEMRRILFCGTHGDPATAKDLYKICEYIIETGPKCEIMIHTNGGLRSKEFWKNLGELFVKAERQHYIAFSIDGLEDTNHLYRRNVKWAKLIDNVRAYTDTGANAHWEYLIFKHNEHQIEEAEKLSKELKFKKFWKKRALGFEAPGGGVIPREIYNTEGKIDYVLEAPSNTSLINTQNFDEEKVQLKDSVNIKHLEQQSPGYSPHVEQRLKTFREDIIPTYNTYVKDHEQYEIKCKSCKSDIGDFSEIYVSCNGIVFPCCFVGTRVDSDIDLYEDTQLRFKIRQFGADKFNLKKNNIVDIIKNGYLDSVYTESWSKPSVEQGKLSYCAMTCGEKSQVDKIYEGLND